MVVLRDESGEPLRMIGTLADIDERKHNEEKLRLAACVFASAGEGILITSADGKIVDVNSSFTRITGYSRDEVIGKDPRLLSSSRHQTEFFAAMWRDLNETGFWRGEIWNRRKNGQVYTEIQTITAVRDAQDKVQYYVALYSDISQLKERESDLEQIAHYDALTGLPNRVLLADRLRQAMASTQRRERQLAVAFLDLDGFKSINDQYGHEVGDLMLIAISNRMKQALRDGDTIARLGGDEFVALLPDLVDVASCLPMLARIVSDVAQPVSLGEHVLQISVSLGVTFFPQKTSLEADDLLRQADHAMYKAKMAGKNRYHLFSAD
jgi:diguanylate cyclase (GGDEF)-like protein/PAS domain S-box-containing protein